MSQDGGLSYVGDELTLFAAAAHWKAYVASQIRPFLGSDVLEVGAGIGATTGALVTPRQRRWVALEPDRTLAAALLEQHPGPPCEVVAGTIEALPPAESFDAVLYVDVLEHIDDDRAELDAAARHLRTGGHLVVLAPAHQQLYSPFDAAIGHFRRYDRGTLVRAIPAAFRCVRLRYLDSVGLAASAANRLLLRQSLPTSAQLRVWDRLMIPCSRVLDPLTGFRLGKSILGIWQKD